jgi:hypothetical protein
MNQREQLELAAKACGYVIEDSTLGDGVWAYPVGAELNWEGELPIFKWNPLADQADSDRMACRLRIEIVFLNGRVLTRHPRTLGILYITHNNTDEDVCRAVREARMAVAVEIGRSK